MPDNKPQGSSVRVMALGFTLIALIALLAIVLVRTKAQTSLDLNQTMNYSPTAMTLTNQALMQESSTTTIDVGGINGATPPNNVHLTAGSLSDPIHLTGTIVNNNGVNLVLVGKKSATLHVIAVQGTTQVTGSCKDLGLDGTVCWEADASGDQFVSSGYLTPASGALTQTQATLDVPISLPHFALNGTWTIYWQLVPVNVAGDANPSYALDNSGTSALRMSVDKLVAIDVSANNGSEAVYSAVGGGSIVPLVASAPVTIAVTQKGNVVDFDKVYGTDWTNSSNGQTMPVGITHFLGTALPSYTDKDAETLVSGGPDYAIQVYDSGKKDWVVPTSVGSQDGTVKTAGTNHYDTMIMSPAGRTGSFTATLTNIAADASGSGKSANDPLTVVGSAEISAHPTGIVSSNALTVVTHYTSSANGLVRFISTEDPTAPMLFPSPQSMNTTPDGLGLAISGTNVFVANYDEGTLSVFDASAPTDPVYHTVNVGTNPDAIAVSGHYVYVLNKGDGTMSVVDVSNLNSPSVVTTLSGFSVPTTIAINQSGSTAYVYDDDNGQTAVVNIQDPANPSIVTWFGGQGLGRMTVSGQRLYVIDFGLSIYDISSPLAPVLLGHSVNVIGYSGNGANSASDVRVSGNYAYVSDHSGLITAIDVSDPSHPVPVESAGFQVAGDVAGIAIDGSYLYGIDAAANSLFIMDIGNTSYQTAVGPRGSVANGAYTADLYNGFVVTTNFYTHSLSVVNVSNPASPTVVGTLTNLGNIKNVRVDGSYAFAYSYIGGQNKFLVVNLSNPSAPSLTYSLTVPANLGGDITIYGDRAYLQGNQYNLLGIVNVSNLAAPTYLGTVNQPSGVDQISSATVVGTTAYLASSRASGVANNKVLVYDVSNPSSPTYVKSITVGTSPSRVIVDGSVVYVANETDKSVSVIDATSAANASVVSTVSVSTQPLSLYVRGLRLYVSGLSTTGVYQLVAESPSTAPSFIRNIPGGGSGGQTVVSTDARYLYSVVPTGYSLIWDWALSVIDLGTN